MVEFSCKIKKYRDNRKESLLSSLLPDTCQPGYTKLCPMDGSYCPSSSLTLCPVREQEEEEEVKEEEDEESMRAINSEVVSKSSSNPRF